ncbi:TIGR02302 family protein [Thalassovita mangrovi]|uniref:TIGR02302 family protein n=1 Tax=Thalassovita mangrovi TaxID=2692236 RepID=A0A6L8LNS8_9RHOB|nr:TIGR02302 family protein [Thalassovita mangrovi]MYM57233.1 TIGR02302 family protein [Thalassovita mangrovi]
MAEPRDAFDTKVRWPLRLTWAGLIAERVTVAFWPFWSVAMACLALLMMGLHRTLAVELVWSAVVVAIVSLALTFWFGIWKFRWPRRAEAVARLDATMVGRPLQTLADAQAIGAGDAASEALWREHRKRMAARLSGARAVRPDLKLSRRDPFALRYVALLGVAVGLMFGSLGRIGDVGDLGGGGQALAAGPSWEGWIEPPAYTGLPVLYLPDQAEGDLSIPEGSGIILRFYGEVGKLTLAETVSGRIGEVPPASDPEQQFAVAQGGKIEINGPGGRAWDVAILPDAAPAVTVAGPPETTYEGQMSLPFEATDDYGVVAGRAVIALDLDAVDRRYGLAMDPEQRPEIIRDLPLPIAGSRAEFAESLIDDFSQHPWAHLPVVVTLEVNDEAGQTGMAEPARMALPARRFFDPLAAAVVEQRRDLLWNRQNAGRVAQVLRAVSWKPEENLFRSEADYLQFRVILRRLETYAEAGITADQRDEIAQALWDLALALEEGDIDDARERMARAQERLSEAMKRGASESEIAELMQELRDATQDYLRQLSRQAQKEQDQNDEFDSADAQNMMQMDMNDLQRMMDRIQELMEQGRMAEAQQALEELQQLMENMRVTQGGEGQGSPGQQAMDNLAETLRDQQGLSDQAFRDLQEQFNPGANQGQSQGNQGRNGGEGQGQSHEGQGGQGDGAGETGQSGDRSLAERQRDLRDELNRQRGNLPGEGTEGGQAAREALEQADRAMRGAEDALRQDDLAGAIDKQAEAMDALREGIRNLGEAMAEAQREQQGGQGQAMGNAGSQQRDPLGRKPGSRGALGGDDSLLQGEDVYRRARELLDEIRRRSGEGDRSQDELDYLKRLLERF